MHAQNYFQGHAFLVEPEIFCFSLSRDAANNPDFL